MLYYHYIIIAILAVILVNFLVNMFLFKNIRNYLLPESIVKNPPLVSVLVPARNEGENIYRCVSSLLKQDYLNLEIIVLDDNSMDDTAQIVKEMAKKDSRVRLVSGLPLKKGWMGKCWACQQLSAHASGDYFIFTDADTVHFNNTVSKAFASMLSSGLDAISVYPKQITVTFNERMTVPFINFAILTFMPLLLVKYAKSAFFSTGIGQFFMFKREAYEKMGGHESIKSEVLEDIHLSKQVKREGFKFMIFDGRQNIYCRMYRNPGDLKEGFSKVIYSAFNYNPFVEAVAMTAFSALFLFPFIFLPAGAMIFGWPGFLITLNVIQVLMIFIIKIVLALRFKLRILDVFFMPVSICYMIYFAVNSFWQARYRKGISWKGRVYSINSEDEAELVEDNYSRISN